MRVIMTVGRCWPLSLDGGRRRSFWNSRACWRRVVSHGFMWYHTVLYGWGTYERHITPEQHVVGKLHTQKIESKHSNLRTCMKRLVRRTMCCSTTTTMRELVVG